MKEIRAQRYYEAEVREIAAKLGICVAPNEAVLIYEKGHEFDREAPALVQRVVIVIDNIKL